MKLVALVATISLCAACAGCFLLPGSTDPSVVEDVPDHLRKAPPVVPPAPDGHPYGDVSRLRVGQWATYGVGTRTLTLRAVAREADGLWVEEVDEGEPRQVSARLVSPDGAVRKAFYGELHKDGSRSSVHAQPLAQSAPPAPPPASGPAAEERVTVDGRELAARSVRVRTEDLEGKIREQVWLWHPDVPRLYAGSEHGGLVSRKGSGEEVMLRAFGSDAKPLLEGIK